jgi:hypothetical protein
VFKHAQSRMLLIFFALGKSAVAFLAVTNAVAAHSESTDDFGWDRLIFLTSLCVGAEPTFNLLDSS